MAIQWTTTDVIAECQSAACGWIADASHKGSSRTRRAALVRKVKRHAEQSGHEVKLYRDDVAWVNRSNREMAS